MMDGLPENPDAQRLAEMLRQQQLQQMMQRFQANAPVNQAPIGMEDRQPPMQNNMGSPVQVAGGQMPDIPVPQGVPQGFLNPQQTFQRGINMTPMQVSGSMPMGEGRLHGNMMGSNVAAPGYNRTSLNQIGMGYSAPVGGGTLSANVNVPTQGNNYNAMLRYNKPY
jgi:hypothetical protein